MVIRSALSYRRLIFLRIAGLGGVLSELGSGGSGTEAVSWWVLFLEVSWGRFP